MRSFSKCQAAVRRRFQQDRRILRCFFPPVHGAPGGVVCFLFSRHPHLYMDFQTVPVCFSVQNPQAALVNQMLVRHLLLRDGRGLRRKRMSSLSISTPASSAFRCIGGIFRASVGNGFRMAAKSEISTPSNPISPRRISRISHLLVLAGTAVDRVK